MMGPEQEKWLFNNLATVKARWTVIGQQVYSFAYDRLKANPEGQFSMDKWDGYVAARQRLYGRLLETHAPNPIVLSGDGRPRAPTTRISSITATAAATLPARRRRPRCAPTSRSSTR